MVVVYGKDVEPALSHFAHQLLSSSSFLLSFCFGNTFIILLNTTHRVTFDSSFADRFFVVIFVFTICPIHLFPISTLSERLNVIKRYEHVHSACKVEKRQVPALGTPCPGSEYPYTKLPLHC